MLKWLLGWNDKENRQQDKAGVLNALYLGDRGITDLHDNDAVIRLWLPEPLRIAIDQTSTVLINNESGYLREFLVVYLYGIHELLRMRANQTGLYYQPPPKPKSSVSSGDILFSRAKMEEIIPGLGKNIVAVKLRLPSKIKNDLQQLANQREMPLGRFVREIFVQHFLGHTVWPDHFTHLPEQQHIADEWVNGRIESITIPSENVDTETDTPVENYC